MGKVATVLVSACALVAVLPLSADAEAEERPLHGPIRILSDAAFLMPPEVSGVRGGSGTPEDPYRIEGWTFVLPRMWNSGLMGETEGLDGIVLAGTSKHVVVADNVFLAEPNRWQFHPNIPVPNGTHPAVTLLGATNVTIRGNDFRFGGSGDGTIRLGLSAPRYGQSPPEAEAAAGGSRAVIVENDFETAGLPAVVVRAGTVDVVANRFVARPVAYLDHYSRALVDLEASEGRVVGNTMTRTDEAGFASMAVAVRRASGPVDVRANVVTGFEAAFAPAGAILTDNVFEDVEYCILFPRGGASSGNDLTGCRVPFVDVGRDHVVGEGNVVPGGRAVEVRDAAQATVDGSADPVGWVRVVDSGAVTIRNVTVLEGETDIGASSVTIENSTFASTVASRPLEIVANASAELRHVAVRGDRDPTFVRSPVVTFENVVARNSAGGALVVHHPANLTIDARGLRVDGGFGAYSSACVDGRLQDYGPVVGAAHASLSVHAACGVLDARGGDFSKSRVSMSGSWSGTGLLDARDAWWGAVSGPRAVDNPGGTGTPVHGNVLYRPWATSAP